MEYGVYGVNHLVHLPMRGKRITCATKLFSGSGMSSGRPLDTVSRSMADRFEAHEFTVEPQQWMRSTASRDSDEVFTRSE